ncbi:MAG TPA: hypothetical protein VGS96_14450 [Thermoanaerobaculia bacterium]|nr:hypothetical protein [Thermoanaerobaculia bacterium]
MICVVEGLVAKPKEAYIYDVEPDSPEKRSSRHVKIHWFSQRTVDLDVTFKTAGCVENLTCDRRGHCEATVSVTLKKGEQKRCTYKTKLFGQKDPEEDIVINPCCM